MFFGTVAGVGISSRTCLCVYIYACLSLVVVVLGVGDNNLFCKKAVGWVGESGGTRGVDCILFFPHMFGKPNPIRETKRAGRGWAFHVCLENE